MREATALKRRVSFRVAGLPEPIVAGFRSNDYFSVFFDQDPVYQFDNEGRLRRAYRNGLLYRTQGSTLAQLQRVRTAEQTTLKRSDLEPAELREFLAQMTAFIQGLWDAVRNGTAEIQQQIPDNQDIDRAVATALEAVLSQKTEPLAAALPTRPR